MAKIRAVKPDLFRHPGLFKAEVASGLPLRLAFIGLFTACDREGRFVWVPETLKLDCLPFDNIDFSSVMDALETSGFVIRYVVDNKVYGCIPTWKKHQHIGTKEAESKLPAYDQGIHLPCQVNSPDGSGNGSGSGNGIGSDTNQTQVPAAKPPRVARPAPAGFEEFWKAYPKKVAKGAAIKAWAKAGQHLTEILAALEWQRKCEQWTKNGTQFVPNPATYLNEQRWLDENPNKKVYKDFLPGEDF